MGITKHDVKSMGKEKLKKKMIQFIERCKQKENQLFSDAESSEEDDLMVEEKPEELVDAYGKPFLYPKNENYFTSVADITTQERFKALQLPENTLFRLRQAKYIHAQNSNLPAAHVNKTVGVFIGDLEVVGQILPANDKASPEFISESQVYSAEKQKESKLLISNPTYVIDNNTGKHKFVPNFQSNQAAFLTIADERGGRHFFDFGAEKLEGKQARSNYGRHKRNHIPQRVNVYFNASLTRIITNSRREDECSIYLVRRTQTDPVHTHNLGYKNNHLMVDFYPLSQEDCLKYGLYEKHQIQGKTKIKDAFQYSFDDPMYLKGNSNACDSITSALMYVLKCSENQFKENYEKGAARDPLQFKVAVSNCLDINGVGTSSANREGRPKKTTKKAAAATPVAEPPKERERSRSPHRDTEEDDVSNLQ